MPRIRQLPAHHHHEREAEKQEDQPGDHVLDPDHLVIRREDVFPPPAELVVIVAITVVMRIVRGAWRRMMRVRSEVSRGVHVVEI